VKFKFIFVLMCMSSFPMCSRSFLAPMCLSLCFSLCFLTPTTIPHHSCHSTQHLLLSHIYVVFFNIPPPKVIRHLCHWSCPPLQIIKMVTSKKVTNLYFMMLKIYKLILFWDQFTPYPCYSCISFLALNLGIKLIFEAYNMGWLIDVST